ncbi:MAG: insulinase family protein [Alphaproteobacteria bacterium]|nr:insulinase family protein [Alphaproteobacteria bacterium]
MTRPRFDAEPVERVRRQIVSRLRREAQDTGSVASRTLLRTIFPDHAYGRPTTGTPESVARIAVEDLRAFAAQRLGRDTLVIGAVGDIAPEALGPLVDQAFGSLSAASAPFAIPEVAPATDGGVTVVRMAVPQTEIQFAQAGLKRDHPDFYAATVLNQIVGGAFTSRLYQEVRERRGLVYSVYSSLAPLDRAGLILGGAATENARARETVEVIRGEWRRLQAEGPSAAELEDAKLFLTDSFPLRFTSSGRIAAILVGMQLDDLGIDYLDKRNALIEAVTLADVRRLAGSVLAPDRLTFVAVGQPEGLGAAP